MSRKRDWMPHEGREIRTQLDCPATGLDRFATVDLARHALLYGLGEHHLVPVACEDCGGVHNVDDVQIIPQDCDPVWVIKTRDVTTIDTGDYL